MKEEDEDENKEGKTTSNTDITKWWKHVDDRFFWNKHMLSDIFYLGVSVTSLTIISIHKINHKYYIYNM